MLSPRRARWLGNPIAAGQRGIAPGLSSGLAGSEIRQSKTVVARLPAAPAGVESMDQNDLNLVNQLFFAHGDPHSVWKRLRAEDPVHWTDGGLSRGFWSVTKLEDVQAVYRDAATFKSDR